MLVIGFDFPSFGLSDCICIQKIGSQRIAVFRYTSPKLLVCKVFMVQHGIVLLSALESYVIKCCLIVICGDNESLERKMYCMIFDFTER